MRGPAGLIRWQWEGYPRYHRSRTNLLLHVLTVPLFCLGTVLLAWGAIGLSWPPATMGAGGMLLALVAQGRGHKLEAEPPVPFTGPGNFIGRFFFEQWINFPRFLLSGGWRRGCRAGKG